MKDFLKKAMIVLIMCIITGVVFAFTFDALQDRKIDNSKEERTTENVKEEVVVSNNTNNSDTITAINKAQDSVFNVNVKSDVWGYGMRNISSGSGVLYKEDKDYYYIITNNHVIRDGAKVSIRLNEEDVLVSIVGSDADTDIAVLKLDKSKVQEKLTVPSTRDIKDLKIGENVFAIGNALGYGQSVTKGIISALERDVDNRASKFSYKLIQTDAAINPGNSGGALVDANGKVIGINVLKIAMTNSGRGVEGMGFAIPISAATNISDVILSKGYLPKAYLGVGTQDLDLEFLEINKIPKGVLVKRVVPNQAADKSGILPNDLIVKVDDVEIHNSNILGYEIRKHAPGDIVKIEIFRNNELKTIEVKLGKTEKNKR